MKTAMIARFVLGASAIFAAAGLVGCGAEQGSGEPGAIGSTSEALSNGSAVKDLKDAVNNDAMHTDVNPDPVGRELAASCVIVDGTTSKLLSIGGFTSTGTGLAEVFAYTPGSPGTWTSVATLAHPRGFAKAIQVPGDTHSCLLVGGTTTKAATTDVATAEKITISGGTWTVADAGNFSVGHNFGLSRCGTSDVIAFGGISSTTYHNAIKRWNSTTGTTAWASLKNTNATPHDVTLVAARHSFAYAVQDESANTQIIVAGGIVSGGTVDNTLEALRLTSGCALDSTTQQTAWDLSNAGMGPALLTTARYGAVMFPTTSTAMLIAVGDDNTGVLNTQETFTVTWAGTPSITTPSASTPANPALTAVRYPALVKVSQYSWLFAGGENHSGVAIANTAAIQKYSATTLATPTNLVTGRRGLIAENVSGTVYAGEGVDPSSNFLTTFEAITP